MTSYRSGKCGRERRLRRPDRRGSLQGSPRTVWVWAHSPPKRRCSPQGLLLFYAGPQASLAADEGLEIDLKFCVHDSLAAVRCRVAENEVILHRVVQRWRQVRIYLLIVRCIGREQGIARVSSEQVRILPVDQQQKLDISRSCSWSTARLNKRSE